ncbi:MAG: hypothetical protein ABL926_12840 [Novosphingobium sp.]
MIDSTLVAMLRMGILRSCIGGHSVRICNLTNLVENKSAKGGKDVALFATAA